MPKTRVSNVIRGSVSLVVARCGGAVKCGARGSYGFSCGSGQAATCGSRSAPNSKMLTSASEPQMQEAVPPTPPPTSAHHLGDLGLGAGLRRAISQVSMIVAKATSSGEVAWREEAQKYVAGRIS